MLAAAALLHLPLLVNAAAPAVAAPTPALGVPARLDTSFGGGFVTHSFSDVDDDITAVAVAPDGAVIAVGETGFDLFNHVAGEMLVLRYTPAGRLDPSFGTDGAAIIPLNGDTATGVAVSPDGRIVVSGRSTVLRLTAEGVVDPDFHALRDGAGLPTLGIIAAIALQPDGKILLTGSPFAVGRLNADGTFDQSFGTGGLTMTPTDPFDPARLRPMYRYKAMALQPDGRIVLGGSSSGPSFGAANEFVGVSRYTATGELDTGFGNKGTVATNLDTTYADRGNNVNALALQPDGRIVVVGEVYQWSNGNFTPRPGYNDMAILRYTADGQLDPSFSGDGKIIARVPHLTDPTSKVFTLEGGPVTLTMPETMGVPNAVSVGADGSVYVAGWAQAQDNHPVVLRFTAAGLLDTTFGRGGQFLVDTPGQATAMAMQSDGRLVVAGMARTGDNVEGHYRDVLVGRIVPGASVGSVWAWGWNATGQLGDGTRTDRASPVAVPGLSQVTAVSAGPYHTLALRGDGTVWAWGMNVFGELGDGTTVDRQLPVKVSGLSGVMAIAAGGLHSLAVRGDGTVWAWGWNGLGQLGDGSVLTRLSPVQVPGLAGMEAVSAGLYHSVATRDDGWSATWGYNAVGQLGDGTTADRHSAAWLEAVFPSEAHDQVSAGALHNLALTGYGRVEGWGWNGMQQLGSVAEVAGVAATRGGVIGDSVNAVSAGWYHSLAVEVDGTVKTAGWNALGQLGDGTLQTHEWHLIPGLSGIDSAGAGGAHSLAVTADHRLYAWGWNYYGQLGTGGPAMSATPVVVPLSNVAAASAGFVHSVAIRI